MVFSKAEVFRTAWHGILNTYNFAIAQKELAILKLDFESY
jgi:hypothetical protein